MGKTSKRFSLFVVWLVGLATVTYIIVKIMLLELGKSFLPTALVIGAVFVVFVLIVEAKKRWL